MRERQRSRERETRERDRERQKKQRKRQRQRQRETDMHTQRQRHTKRDRERETERDRVRHTHTHTHTHTHAEQASVNSVQLVFPVSPGTWSQRSSSSLFLLCLGGFTLHITNSTRVSEVGQTEETQVNDYRKCWWDSKNIISRLSAYVYVSTCNLQDSFVRHVLSASILSKRIREVKTFSWSYTAN